MDDGSHLTASISLHDRSISIHTTTNTIFYFDLLCLLVSPPLVRRKTIEKPSFACLCQLHTRIHFFRMTKSQCCRIGRAQPLTLFKSMHENNKHVRASTNHNSSYVVSYDVTSPNPTNQNIHLVDSCKTAMRCWNSLSILSDTSLSTNQIVARPVVYNLRNAIEFFYQREWIFIDCLKFRFLIFDGSSVSATSMNECRETGRIVTAASRHLERTKRCIWQMPTRSKRVLPSLSDLPLISIGRWKVLNDWSGFFFRRLNTLNAARISSIQSR